MKCIQNALDLQMSFRKRQSIVNNIQATEDQKHSPRYHYVYNEYCDCVVCPEFHDLHKQRKNRASVCDSKEKLSMRYTLSMEA